MILFVRKKCKIVSELFPCKYFCIYCSALICHYCQNDQKVVEITTRQTQNINNFNLKTHENKPEKLF